MQLRHARFGWGKSQNRDQEFLMGLLDEVLKTMQAAGGPNDPRARPAPVPAPTPGAPASHGMSPMAKALLALLAAYAAKNLSKAPSETPTSPSGRSGGTVTADNMPGGGRLDDLLKGPLGGLLRGGQGAGTAAGGGLGDLLKGPLGGLLGGAAAGTAMNGGLSCSRAVKRMPSTPGSAADRTSPSRDAISRAHLGPTPSPRSPARPACTTP